MALREYVEANWLDTPGTRVAAVGLLLAALAVACAGYATLEPDPAANRYPGTVDIVGNEEAYVGESVDVAGTVVETAPVRIADDYTVVRDGVADSGTVRYTVTDVSAAVSRGDSVQVFGTLAGPRTVRATSVVTVPAGNFRYMYGVSFLAGLWVLARLIRGWRVDRHRLALGPRDRSRDSSATRTPGRGRGGEDDPDA